MSTPEEEDEEGQKPRPNPNLSFLDRPPVRAADIPNLDSFSDSRGAAAESKTLTVAPQISLSGTIVSCEKLIVEGTVEADSTELHSLEVASGGTYKGRAEVENATIGGRFEGELTARKLLSVSSSGRVRGTVRYGRLEVEAGGGISGDVDACSKTS